MRPLMISSSMLFDVFACCRSCCASSACKCIHHCLSSCLCCCMVNSILVICHDLIFDDLLVHACHCSCCASSGCKSIHQSLHLVDVIECGTRFLWYFMSRLMMSYSMILDLYACRRSCCASSGGKSIHHCLSSCLCCCMVNSILVICHESTYDLVFDDLWSFCFSTLVLCIFRR